MSAYPPHLSHIAEEIRHVRGSRDLARVFSGDKPLAAVPWPRAPRLPGGHLFDRVAVAEEFRHRLPAVALLHPDTLWASQPSVTRPGVEYYATPTWFRSGITYADQSSQFNRLPVVEVRPNDVCVILNGHHRSCAALLSGTHVLARLVWLGAATERSRVDLRLPSLAVGDWDDAQPVTSVCAAVDAIHDGVAVTVESDAIADQVIAALAGDPQ